MQLPPTAQKLSETQKIPKQSPIRLMPLVYDHNSSGCLYTKCATQFTI